LNREKRTINFHREKRNHKGSKEGEGNSGTNEEEKGSTERKKRWGKRSEEKHAKTAVGLLKKAGVLGEVSKRENINGSTRKILAL